MMSDRPQHGEESGQSDEPNRRNIFNTKTRTVGCSARTVLEQKPHPWNSALRQVSANYSAQCPRLEVRATNGGIQKNPLAALTQTVAKLDVFDLRLFVPDFVEQPCIAKFSGPDSADPRPEAARLATTPLVDVVMKQVSVL